MLEVKELYCGYDDIDIIKNVSFKVNNGENLCIVGPNGCGKTTLVKAILGESAVIKSGYWHTLPRTDIGYLDQLYATLTSSQTVFETISSVQSHWAGGR